MSLIYLLTDFLNRQMNLTEAKLEAEKLKKFQ